MPMRDERRIPGAVQVAWTWCASVMTARRRSEDRDRDVVAAARHPERVKWLVHVADQMHEKFQRDRPVGAIERGVGQAFLVVGDPVDDAVAPPIAGAAPGHASLERAIAVAIDEDARAGRYAVPDAGGGSPLRIDGSRRRRQGRGRSEPRDGLPRGWRQAVRRRRATSRWPCGPSVRGVRAPLTTSSATRNAALIALSRAPPPSGSDEPYLRSTLDRPILYG